MGVTPRPIEGWVPCLVIVKSILRTGMVLTGSFFLRLFLYHPRAVRTTVLTVLSDRWFIADNEKADLVFEVCFCWRYFGLLF